MTDGNTYAINKHLDEREDWDALQEVTAELEQVETETKAYHDAWLEAEAQIIELQGKLAKAMLVVEMLASADVDAVLGEAVDISCEIIGDLMEDEDDE